MILLWILVFIVSVAVLSKSADYFTDAAEEVGQALKLPPFIIGVTIVALGTSLPELAASIVAVINGASEIVAANVIGSNITNIFLVLGVAGIVAKQLDISFELITVDLPLLVGSTFLVSFMMWDGLFSIGEGIICLATLVLYLHYTFSSEQVHDKKEETEEVRKNRPKFTFNLWLRLVFSAIFLFLGAKYTIDSVIYASELLNIGKDIIAISAIALGTSLPELIVSYSAAKKGQAEIAVGNILGSNIFNILGVMGVTSFFGTLRVAPDMISFGIPMMLAATLLYFFITQDKKITKWEGGILLIFYVFFIGKILGLV
jgi:cation:H+ antiporter